MPKFGKVKTPINKKKVPLSPISGGNNPLNKIGKPNQLSALNKKEEDNEENKSQLNE